MFHSVSERHGRSAVLNGTVADLRDHIVIAPHHPDRLRRPPVRHGAHEEERFVQALTWNVFRTLELLPPAFWLRRLHAHLGGEAFGRAAQTVRVTLWRELPLPAAQRIDGAGPGVCVDVLIETEHAVWALLATAGDGRRCLESEPGRGDMVARAADAGSWYAGTRACQVAVLSSPGDGLPAARALVRRHSRSRDSAWIRSGSRGDAPANVLGVGLLCWTQLATILHDCERASVLTDIERALAGNALTWLDRVGVPPG